MLKRKANLSFTVLFVACQLYTGSRYTNTEAAAGVAESEEWVVGTAAGEAFDAAVDVMFDAEVAIAPAAAPAAAAP